MKDLIHILKLALKQNIITETQYEQIIALGQANPNQSSSADEPPRFVMAHLLYYFGGLIAIGAMSLFVTIGFERYGALGIMFISMCYAILGMWLAHRFKRQKLMIPHSIALAFVLVLVPLFVFAVQKWLGIWSTEVEGTIHYREYHHWVSWQWVIMELATLLVGAVMMWRYRRSFVMLPITVTLWYLSMDIALMFVEQDANYSSIWNARRIISLYFGLATTALAVYVDFRQISFVKRHQDFAFWLYIVGALMFWGGLTFNSSDNEWQTFGYFVINLMMMIFGLLIRRRVFVVLAGFGCCVYFGHLANEVFKDSLIFPLVLTLMGLGVVYLGVLWQRHEDKIISRLYGFLPTKLANQLRKLQS